MLGSVVLMVPVSFSPRGSLTRQNKLTLLYKNDKRQEQDTAGQSSDDEGVSCLIPHRHLHYRPSMMALM